MSNVEIIKENNKWDFEKKISKAIGHKKVVDIKFAVIPEIHSTGFGGSYSSGEKYYAMIIFE